MHTAWDRAGGQASATSRLLIFTEHLDATYYISFEMPLATASQSVPVAWRALSARSVEDAVKRSDLHDLLRQIVLQFPPTCVVLTRYALPHGPDILDFFKRLGIRCVYHLDDHLTKLPDSLGSEVLSRHNHPDVIGARATLIAEADVVYASTRRLAEALQAEFPKQKFVSGIYRAYVARDGLSPTRSAAMTIGYMGSRGHAEDLKLVVPAIAKMLTRHADKVRFELFGTIPFPNELEPFRDCVTHHKPSPDYFEFLLRLKSLRWDIGLAPLSAHTFNLCKAPTKFVEYTEAGIVTLASDVEVYREHLQPSGGPRNGQICADDDWCDRMEELIASPAVRERLLGTARQYCADNFSLQVLSAQVLSIVTSGEIDLA